MVKKNRYASWAVLFVLFLIVMSGGGCGVADSIAESFLPDEGQFNGLWRADGHPDIVVSGFDFQDNGYAADANITIGGHDFGRLRFSSNDGDTYVYYGSDGGFMSAKIAHSTTYGYYFFYVIATFENLGINIRNEFGMSVEYTK
ncbi:MAG: hypothetical protein LBQ58_05865 [Synergistaceae bacterium]|jgi:hypothetical protein|nr:hypothetical protein [Synergistaceae bacterium]